MQLFRAVSMNRSIDHDYQPEFAAKLSRTITEQVLCGVPLPSSAERVRACDGKANAEPPQGMAVGKHAYRIKLGSCDRRIP